MTWAVWWNGMCAFFPNDYHHIVIIFITTGRYRHTSQSHKVGTFFIRRASCLLRYRPNELLCLDGTLLLICETKAGLPSPYATFFVWVLVSLVGRTYYFVHTRTQRMKKNVIKKFRSRNCAVFNSQEVCRTPEIVPKKICLRSSFCHTAKQRPSNFLSHTGDDERDLCKKGHHTLATNSSFY